MLVVGLAGTLSHETASSPQRMRIMATFALQCTLILLAMSITSSSAASLRAKLGLPLRNQIAGWVILGMLPPPFYDDRQAVLTLS